MAQYLRIFNFLWRLKRVAYSLGTIWRMKTKDWIKFDELSDLKPYLHRCQLLRHEMTHLVTNIMNYIMVEVVESAWQEFLEEASVANDLDELHKIHTGFLTKILDRSLLNLVTDQLYRQLMKLLELILRFRFIQETLDMSANEEYERRKIIKERKILQQMGSSIHSSDEEEPDYY